MLAQGYFKGQGSSIFTNCIFMTLSDMQSSSGKYLMRHQVPMVSLLLLVYLSAVAYISAEISLGFCWRRDILRVKGFWRKNFWSRLIDNPFNNGFGAKISIHLFR